MHIVQLGDYNWNDTCTCGVYAVTPALQALLVQLCKKAKPKSEYLKLQFGTEPKTLVERYTVLIQE